MSQLCTSTEGFECLRHGLELRRGLFLSFSYIPINQNLEAMAKQLYDYWFVQFDFPNEDGKPYKSSGSAMVWNEELKREIPQGWSNMSIGDYAPCKSGYAFKSKDFGGKGLPVIP